MQMTTYDQDDVVQWTLRLFDTNPYSNYEYCGTIAHDDDVVQNDVNYYHGQYFKEDLYDAEPCSVENDELLAHALQELQLPVEEEYESPQAKDKHLQFSDFRQEWIDQSLGSFISGQDSGQEEVDDGDPSSSCSSPEESPFGKEDWFYSIELTDEHSFDGKVEKSLNQMVPIPHVPKINGEIPSIDEATLDHQRLLDRLQVYDLVELKVQGDGNCQFRALSDQFYQTPEHHEFMRQRIVNQLKEYPKNYEGYVPMAYHEYLEKMSRNGEWGDHVTLQAAADSYGVKIFVITSFKDTCYIEILPNVQSSKRVIFLSFWAEVHYNSIYPQGEMPTLGTKKKKKWRGSRKRLESLEEYQ
ncbi:PREDICTED: uncharacterized protein LOC104814825 [Tarenaya hassleriana]|uniref:uncharacterized protein LOC104814825 n=1 Tax=Tarenaya hassleriana TaxID=28532 RepID=UPI00053C1227|nr:PREDICTED: uncharacterized protein LOC104814825 [Tarenaya hassleriana]XP_010541319.1 PREDICTED: uncharacterized protein LOC104814825 [Tarenaya hassleriana]XP_010541320.1 PREDICTED: uncharacterized protein LOC104814825 [Tarenaya hassleriana]XP_010541321.1 PREDICTED: uncharacterized protein LOC104814825 [Tarenaya hassleriana]XP_010541322.1 PREDICTED: uncharacterized protein LOC104814825 [Tarenaya hassleriana]XP_010541323.1 PREDICTED: uncharacterized protein LOC104814825 [Tarenaya hassleriana]